MLHENITTDGERAPLLPNQS